MWRSPPQSQFSVKIRFQPTCIHSSLYYIIYITPPCPLDRLCIDNQHLSPDKELANGRFHPLRRETEVMGRVDTTTPNLTILKRTRVSRGIQLEYVDTHPSLVLAPKAKRIYRRHRWNCSVAVPPYTKLQTRLSYTRL